MYLKAYIAFLLPLLSHAELEVTIEATASKSTSSILVSGNKNHIITDTEIELYGIDETKLMDGVEKILKARPDKVFLRSPTPEINAPQDDLYAEYQWPQVSMFYLGDTAEIIDVKSEHIVLNQRKYYNSRDIPSTFSVNLDRNVEESMEVMWNADVQPVDEVTLLVAAHVAESGISLMYSGMWGHNEIISKRKMTGSSSMEVELMANETATASLTAVKHTITCLVTYEVTPMGILAINFAAQHEGHHYHGLDINEVMEVAGLTTSWSPTCEITVIFFTEISTSMNQA